MNDIMVNGAAITAAAIAEEAQHHPAGDWAAAERAAAEALVVRELLLQEAEREAIAPVPFTDADGRRETDEEAMIRALVRGAVSVPTVDEENLRRFYDNNRRKFRSPDLFEAAHILYPAHPDDAEALAAATARAEAAIALLRAEPSRFADLARSESACPSASNGGNLGQVSPGQTVPEFETFLVNLEPGQLCPVPVRTRYGVHVLRTRPADRGTPAPVRAGAGTDRLVSRADGLASRRRAVHPHSRRAFGDLGHRDRGFRRAAGAIRQDAMANEKNRSDLKSPAPDRPDLAGAMMPPPPGLLRDPLAYIAAEHGGQRALCNLMEDLAGAPAFDREIANSILRYLGQDFSRHMRDEENDLFPLLRSRCLPEDEIETMLGRLHAEHMDEHRLAGDLAAQLKELLDRDAPAIDAALRERLFQYARSLRRHLALENSIILPLARARLTPEDLAGLSAAMRSRLQAGAGTGTAPTAGR